MQKITLMFSTADTAFSALIRATTWSSWSHVALVDGDSVIEASVFKGVRRVSLADAVRRVKSIQLVELPCRDPAAVIAAAASQIGKPYDYAGVLGLGFRRNWQDDDAWYCSELIAWAFSAASEPRFRADAVRRITPEHLWMLAPANQIPELVFFSALPGSPRS